MKEYKSNKTIKLNNDKYLFKWFRNGDRIVAEFGCNDYSLHRLLFECGRKKKSVESNDIYLCSKNPTAYEICHALISSFITFEIDEVMEIDKYVDEFKQVLKKLENGESETFISYEELNLDEFTVKVNEIQKNNYEVESLSFNEGGLDVINNEVVNVPKSFNLAYFKTDAKIESK